jgi:hypothetical protein
LADVFLATSDALFSLLVGSTAVRSEKNLATGTAGSDGRGDLTVFSADLTTGKTLAMADTRVVVTSLRGKIVGRAELWLCYNGLPQRARLYHYH